MQTLCAIQIIGITRFNPYRFLILDSSDLVALAFPNSAFKIPLLSVREFLIHQGNMPKLV